jgi:hypothetical protein
MNNKEYNEVFDKLYKKWCKEKVGNKWNFQSDLQEHFDRCWDHYFSVCQAIGILARGALDK